MSHLSIAHAIPREEFVAKIKYACIARDEADKDFVIIARTDTFRFEGLEEAMTRLNMAAEYRCAAADRRSGRPRAFL